MKPYIIMMGLTLLTLSILPGAAAEGLLPGGDIIKEGVEEVVKAPTEIKASIETKDPMKPLNQEEKKQLAQSDLLGSTPGGEIDWQAGIDPDGFWYDWFD